MAAKKKKAAPKAYRPKQAFRRKNPDGQWVQFKPWNTYPKKEVAWIDDVDTLFDPA